jgi:transposase
MSRPALSSAAGRCTASRELLGKRVREEGWSVREASEAAGISERRGREWLRRRRANEPMTDRSSRPHTIETTEKARRERVLYDPPISRLDRNNVLRRNS